MGSSPGEAAWQGHRHPWNILVGCMAPEVLRWLRADVALTPGSDAWQALGVSFTGTGTNPHG